MVRDILLILLMLSLLPIGFFVMVRLDRFLSAESPKNEEKKEETLPAEGPKQIFLSENSSNEEIVETIESFRKSHGHISIIIREEEKK